MLAAARSREELVYLQAGERSDRSAAVGAEPTGPDPAEVRCQTTGQVAGSAVLLSISWQDRKLLLKGSEVHPSAWSLCCWLWPLACT